MKKTKKISTIVPSWLIKKSDLRKGIKTLEGLGFEVINRKLRLRLPSPQAKAKELHEAFLRDDVDIVLAQRGGASSMEALPYVDFALIRKHPKLLAGFSDLSTLLNAVYERTGLVTLHAPMIINLTDPTKFTVSSFLNALDGFPDKELFRGAPVAVHRHGAASGTLKGGNLVTLTTLIGTPWEPKSDGCILFLEDVDEKLHEVERYLTQWILSGKLATLKGLILGDFRGIRHADVYRIIRDQMKVAFPVVHCPYIGHVKNKITLPVGAKVTLNTRKKTLTILP